MGTAAAGAVSRSGTVLVTGGGTVTVLGQEGAQRQVVVTGGGLTVASGTKSAVRSVLVSGGGVIAEAHTTARAGLTLVQGGGGVQVTSGAAAPEPAQVFTGGVYWPHVRPRYVEQHEGRVRVLGGGSLDVVGEKSAREGINVGGGGGADVSGDTRYPRQYQAALITALAA
jgi:hypothetical protein